jgi:hypothetical protein
MAPSCAFREAPCHGSVETKTDSSRRASNRLSDSSTRFQLAKAWLNSLARARVVYPGGLQARTQISSGHSLTQRTETAICFWPWGPR